MEGRRGSKPAQVEKSTRICDWYDVGRKLHASLVTGCEIFCALHKITGELVAIKAVDRAKLGRNYAQPVNLYSKLQHPHICQLLEVFDSQHFVMVCEIVDGMSLTDFMKNNGLAANESQQVMHQLSSAVAYMHSEGVCHRHLSLDNVMLAAGPTCNVKVIDFGNAGPTLRPLTRKMQTQHPLFSAPELFESTVEYFGAQTDVWAMGVILHVLLIGKFPFTTEKEIREKPLTLPDGFDEQAASLLRGMLNRDATARLTASAVLQQPWVAAGGEALGVNGVPNSWGEPQADEAVLSQLAQLGFDPAAVSEAVSGKKRDEFFTSYFLMERRPAPDPNDEPPPDPAEGEAPDARSKTAPAVPLGDLNGTTPRNDAGADAAVCPSA